MNIINTIFSKKQHNWLKPSDKMQNPTHILIQRHRTLSNNSKLGENSENLKQLKRGLPHKY